MAAATRQLAVNFNTPPVNFDAYQTVKNSTTNKSQIDPFVIKGIGNIILNSIPSTGLAPQGSTPKIVSHSTPATKNADTNLVAKTSHTTTPIQSAELFIPKVVYFCHKS